MKVQLYGTIPVFLTWLAMAWTGARLTAGQSPPDSSTGASQDPSMQYSRYPGMQMLAAPRPHSTSVPDLENADGTSDRGLKTSKGAPKATDIPATASQWTAGVKSFGAGSTSSWGPKIPDSDADSAEAWQPETESFAGRPQPGGVWVVQGVRLTEGKSTLQSASQEMMRKPSQGMNPSFGGNRMQRMNPSTIGNLTQGTNASPAGNPTQGMYPSTGNYASPASLTGAQSNSLGMPPTTPWGNFMSTREYQLQSLNGSAGAISHSVGQMLGSASKHGVASAPTPKMKSSLLHRAGGMGTQAQGRAGFRRVGGSGFFGTSSLGRSERKAMGGFGQSSGSFGASGRRTQGRTSGRAHALAWTRRSLSESSDEESQDSYSSRDSFSSRDSDTEQTRPGLRGELGQRSRRLGFRGLQRNRGERGAGNLKERGGKSDHNQGLTTHLIH